MKILLVTPVHPKLQKKNPLPDWQTQNHWHLALKSLGHQVKIFRLPKLPVPKILQNLRLKTEINIFKPDEIFFSAGINRTLPLKNTVFFSGVPPKTLSKNERNTGLKAKLVVTNDFKQAKTWEKLGSNKAICLPISAINPKFFKPTKIKKTINLSFIGTLFPDRQQFLAKLLWYYKDINIYGYLPQIKLLPELKNHYYGPVWGKDVNKIYNQSKIALNLTPKHLPSAGNLRAFEIPATKTLILSDKINSEWYLKNKEAVLIKTPRDTANKIRYYLKNPKKAETIAKAGYLRTIKDHTYKIRFKKLINLIK